MSMIRTVITGKFCVGVPLNIHPSMIRDNNQQDGYVATHKQYIM